MPPTNAAIMAATIGIEFMAIIAASATSYPVTPIGNRFEVLTEEMRHVAHVREVLPPKNPGRPRPVNTQLTSALSQLLHFRLAKLSGFDLRPQFTVP